MKTLLLQGEEVVFSRIAGGLFGCYGEFAAYNNVRQIEKELAKGEADEPYIVVFTPDSSPEQRLNLLEKIRSRGSIKVIQLGGKSATEEQNQLSWPLSAMKLHRFLSSDGFVSEQPPPFAKKIVADLINSLGGDEAFVREETESFFALLPQKLAEMEKTEAQGLSEAVHKLSSTSALYGAMGLSLLFLELEYLLRSGVEVVFADWKEPLEEEFARCRTFLPELWRKA